MKEKLMMILKIISRSIRISIFHKLYVRIFIKLAQALSDGKMKIKIFALLMLSFAFVSFKRGKTMIYKSNFYSIEYDKKSEKLVQNVNEALMQNFQRVLDFWGIEKLEKHVNIRIYSELDEWIKFFEEQSGTKYQDYVVGLADGPNIYVLAYDEYKKSNMHKNDSLEDFQRVIVHEFVHICHNQLLTGWENYSFIMGVGLATYLAGQPYNHDVKIDYPKNSLFSNDFFSLSNDLYSIAQKIVRELVEKVPHEKLIEYALDSTKLYKDWDELFYAVEIE